MIDNELRLAFSFDLHLLMAKLIIALSGTLLHDVLY